MSRGRIAALLVLTLVTTAGAQQPGTRPAPPVPAAAGIRPVAPTPAPAVRPLRQLAAEATAAVVADVTRSETYDQDRLRVHRLAVLRVLRGRLEALEPGVVELPGTAPRAALNAGQRVVVLLAPPPRYSYLEQHLPAGEYYQVVGGADGVILVGSDAGVDAIERALAEGAASAGLAGAAADAARRRLAFAELESGNRRLIIDAVAELRGLEAFGPLAADEAATLGRVLGDRRVDPSARTQLIAVLAERKVEGALPVLQRAEADTPAVLEALLAARATLGAPAGRAELGPQLAASDPQVRAAAVRALARVDDPRVLDELARHATLDPDMNVRVAAIEALGARKRPDAVPILARTFAATDPRMRQGSARAMMTIGGPEVERTLVDLALHGSSPETRKYAALVLIITSGRDSPAVQRLAAANPAPEVKDLLEHGLEFTDRHD